MTNDSGVLLGPAVSTTYPIPYLHMIALPKSAFPRPQGEYKWSPCRWSRVHFILFILVNVAERFQYGEGIIRGIRLNRSGYITIKVF